MLKLKFVQLDAAEGLYGYGAVLSIKYSNKTANLIQEYYSYRERKYNEHIQHFINRSKDPLTEATEAAADWG